jgi:hypothetical protein
MVDGADYLHADALLAHDPGADLDQALVWLSCGDGFRCS